MSTVVILGGGGMLGIMLADVFVRVTGLRVYASFHRSKPNEQLTKRFADRGGRWYMSRLGQLLPPHLQLGKDDWILNAAGAIPHRVGRGKTWREILAMTEANVEIPCSLAEISERTGCRVINVTTDCVYDGKPGDCLSEGYGEISRTPYSLTKLLGELEGERFRSIRCSVIGPEPRKDQVSLFGWLLQHEKNDSVLGFTDHLWNGITTLALARVALGLVGKPELFDRLRRVQHLVPGDSMTKCDLLKLIAKHFKREDLIIHPEESGDSVDRVIVTDKPELNRELWKTAGYDDPPKIEAMLEELARHDFVLAEAVA